MAVSGQTIWFIMIAQLKHIVRGYHEVQVHNSPEVATQVDRVVKKAYGMLVFMGWAIEYKSREVFMMQLYGKVVRPHFEYWVQFWLLHLTKAMVALERKFVRMIIGLGCISYRGRLSRLGLFYPE